MDDKIKTPSFWVCHKDSKIAVASSAFGPDNYGIVGQKILSNNLNVPTGDYTTSLLHQIYCNSEVKSKPGFENVREIIKKSGLWIFNINLWTNKGVYVVQDLKAIGEDRLQFLDINNLEETLNGGEEINEIRFSKNGRVRFAPKESYRFGEHASDTIARDGFIIASFKPEGAEKFAESLSKFENNSYIYGIETEISIQRVSSIVEGDNNLKFFGDSLGNHCKAHAFGLLKQVA